MTARDGDDHRSEIVRLEAQIDELEATIESCRKFILAGRIAIAIGALVRSRRWSAEFSSIRRLSGSRARRCSAALSPPARTTAPRKKHRMN
jgi:hypothetical protein